MQSVMIRHKTRHFEKICRTKNRMTGIASPDFLIQAFQRFETFNSCRVQIQSVQTCHRHSNIRVHLPTRRYRDAG